MNGGLATQLIWYVCAWITIMMCDDEYVLLKAFVMYRPDGKTVRTTNDDVLHTV